MQGIAGVHVGFLIHEFIMVDGFGGFDHYPHFFALPHFCPCALATFVYLRSKEDEGDDGTYLTWAEALEWHLAIALRNPCEDDALRGRTRWREFCPRPLLLPELPS